VADVPHPINLYEPSVARLTTRAPFHLEATVRVLQRRPANLVDVWEQGRYLRVLAVPRRGLALVEVENRGTIDAPDVRFSILGGHASPTDLGAAQTLRKVLGLDVDPKPLLQLARAEPALRTTLLALRGMRPPRFADLFEAFASVLPFQQLSLDAGLAIVGRLVVRFGQHLERGGRRYHAFPTAEAIGGARLERLRSCGLSARKARTLRSVARAIASRELTEEGLSKMSTSQALETLTALDGIGPWSAGLVLLRGLGRNEVFPPGDIGAARSLTTLMRRGAGTPFGDVIERFADHRGYLYFCALGGSLLAKGLIHAAPASARCLGHCVE
jgi:DNA-3-methyladenine glycosylase II